MPERQRTAEFADRFVLPDGTPVRMRAVAAGDRQLLQDMYAELSHRSRYRRFFSTPPRLTEPALDHLVDDVDQVDHVAVVLFAPAGEDGEEAVGVGRMIRYAADPTTADIALAVATNGRGEVSAQRWPAPSSPTGRPVSPGWSRSPPPATTRRWPSWPDWARSNGPRPAAGWTT
jgi:hypothetical protein